MGLIRGGGGSWRPSPLTAVVVSAALGIAGNLATSTVQVRWEWWPVACWAAVAVLLVFAVVIEVARSSVGSGPTVRDLGPVTAVLVERVKGQWEREAGLRQLFQPVPLRVRWSSTGRPVAASRDVVLDEPGSDWQELPLHGDGGEIASAFRGLPHGQLVVIGSAGAGKSVLVMLLTLSLIKDWQLGEAVPTLLPISSWDPAAEEIAAFVARRLGEDYPDLARPGEGEETMAGLLVDRGLVLPILDGMDELPARLHSRAVEALDRWAGPGRPVVVTCRTGEYERAVNAGGSLISRAAVIEIGRVTAEDAIEFLSHPAPGRARWQPVFDCLRLSPNGPLARTLSTPLMVALARTAYRSPASDPAGLLALRDGPAVAAFLIEGFIRSIYSADDLPRKRTLHRRRRTYPADSAVRWLGCLAYHLYQAGTSDLWWWQLAPGFMSPQPDVDSDLILGSCVLAATGCGFAAGLPYSALAAVSAAAAAAVAACAGAAGWFRFMWPASFPPSLPHHYRPSRQRHADEAVARVWFGVMFGLLAGLMIAQPLLGAAGGTAYGLTALVMRPVPVPAGRRRRTGPLTTARANRRNALTAAVQYGLTGGIIFAVLARFMAGPAVVPAAACSAALVYGVAAAFSAGLWTWVRFRAAHLHLAAHRRLPLRLWAFLDDAHHRGALRQAGTAWQFRHALLQDHLAETTHQRILRARAYAGDRSAAYRLAQLLTEQGHEDEAIAVLRVRANFGDLDAAQRLAGLLARLGREGELRARADAGDRSAAYRLAQLLTEQGHEDEAIAVLRVRADTGDLDAAQRFAGLLAQLGREGELRARADAGSASAAEQLAQLLTQQRREGDLRARADAGDHDAVERLAELLAQEGREQEAIAVLRVPANAGDPRAAEQLAQLLALQGREQEAIAVLRVPANAGDPNAAEQLGRLLALQGREQEAIAVLRISANVGDLDAARRLAELLAQQGHEGELRARAAAGNRDAARWLAELLAQQGREEEAIAVLRARANISDPFVARRLAELLAQQGREEEAIAVLRAHADTGDPDSARELAELLAQQGRDEEAIAVLRARANISDPFVARRLAELLARQRREGELQARADSGWPASIADT